MPVVVFFLASTDTVNGVWKCEVLSWTISGRSSSSLRFSVSETQISPRASLAMKLIASGVTFSAAIIRSPSFSRSSSSTMMIILPCFRVSTGFRVR